MSSTKKQVGGYILDKKIGKGSFAEVWRGKVDATQELVAVKVISRQTIQETAQLKQEVNVLKKLSSPHIVRFKDLKKSASHFYLILEYCNGGDLSSYLQKHGQIQEPLGRLFLRQLASGLNVLHRHNFIHRDLKPQNILLIAEKPPVLRIADFGFSRALMPQDMAATICGSPLYMAPEILRHEKYDAKADLWSVGAILFECFCGRPPFNGPNPMHLLQNIENSKALDFPRECVLSDRGREFLHLLLEKDPPKRLSGHAFMDHAYVASDLELDETALCLYSAKSTDDGMYIERSEQQPMIMETSAQEKSAEDNEDPNTGSLGPEKSVESASKMPDEFVLVEQFKDRKLEYGRESEGFENGMNDLGLENGDKENDGIDVGNEEYGKKDESSLKKEGSSGQDPHCRSGSGPQSGVHPGAHSGATCSQQGRSNSSSRKNSGDRTVLDLTPFVTDRTGPGYAKAASPRGVGVDTTTCPMQLVYPDSAQPVYESRISKQVSAQKKDDTEELEETNKTVAMRNKVTENAERNSNPSRATMGTMGSNNQTGAVGSNAMPGTLPPQYEGSMYWRKNSNSSVLSSPTSWSSPGNRFNLDVHARLLKKVITTYVSLAEKYLKMDAAAESIVCILEALRLVDESHVLASPLSPRSPRTPPPGMVTGTVVGTVLGATGHHLHSSGEHSYDSMMNKENRSSNVSKEHTGTMAASGKLVPDWLLEEHAKAQQVFRIWRGRFYNSVLENEQYTWPCVHAGKLLCDYTLMLARDAFDTLRQEPSKNLNCAHRLDSVSQVLSFILSHYIEGKGRDSPRQYDPERGAALRNVAQQISQLVAKTKELI